METDLLGSIYEGPLEEPPWSSFLEALRVRTGTLTATLVLRFPSDPRLGLMVSRGQRRFESAYKEASFVSDPFVNLAEGEITTLADVMPPEELAASVFYREFLEPAGVLHVMGVDLRAPGGLEGRLRLARGADQPPFDATDRDILDPLVAHLRRALRIHGRLTLAESERDVFAHAVDRLSVGAILLDVEGAILQTNAAVDDLIERKAGLGVRDGMLVGASASETKALAAAIERGLEKRRVGEPDLVEALRLCAGDGGNDLGLLIRPIPRGEQGEGRVAPALAIFVSDPKAKTRVPLDVVRELFDLTPAEASLATRLASGQTLDEACGELGIARNTARAQLRSVFDKVGVSRQADLVRLVLRSVAAFGREAS